MDTGLSNTRHGDTWNEYRSRKDSYGSRSPENSDHNSDFEVLSGSPPSSERFYPSEDIGAHQTLEIHIHSPTTSQPSSVQSHEHDVNIPDISERKSSGKPHTTMSGTSAYQDNGRFTDGQRDGRRHRHELSALDQFSASVPAGHIKLADGRLLKTSCGRGRPRVERNTDERHTSKVEAGMTSSAGDDLKDPHDNMGLTSQDNRSQLSSRHDDYALTRQRSGNDGEHVSSDDDHYNDVDEDNNHRREDQIDKCKEEIILQAQVIIKWEAWRRLKKNNNLLKSCPKVDVKERVFHDGERKMRCCEMTGCWRDIDVVTGLTAEAVYNYKLEKDFLQANVTHKTSNMSAVSPSASSEAGVREFRKNVDEENVEYMETDEPEQRYLQPKGSENHYQQVELPPSEYSGARPKSTNSAQEQQAMSQKSVLPTEINPSWRPTEDTATQPSASGTTSVVSNNPGRSSRRRNRTFNNYEDTEIRTPPNRTKKVFITKEDLVIMVYEGDITKLSDVDCIVNSTDQWLHHGGGAAAAIKKAAGADFERECAGKVLVEGKCIATGPGNLLYKKVLHINLPNWNSYMYDEIKCQKILQTTFESALKKAKDEKMKSLALSAIGTGAQKYPVDKWVFTVLETLKRHNKLLKNKKTSVDHIHFVDGKKDLLSLLTKGLGEIFPDASRQEVPQSQYEPDTETKYKPSDAAHMTSTQNTTNLPASFDISQSCKVIVYQGDITQFQGDAIVITDDKFLLGSGPLARVVSSLAGDLYAKEKREKRNKHSNPQHGDVVTIRGGNLKCKYVLHGICEMTTSSKGIPDLRVIVRNLLGEADFMKCSKIAVPALFTGYTGMFDSDWYDILVSEICKFIHSTPVSSLREIHLLDIDVKKVDKLCLGLTKHMSTMEATIHRTYPSSASSPVGQHSSPLQTTDNTDANSSDRHRTNMPATFNISRSCQLLVGNENVIKFIGDAIVIPDFTSSGAVGPVVKAVSAAAGEAYLLERRKINITAHQFGDVVVTKAGHLQCDHILHIMCGYSYYGAINKAELKSLVVAILNKSKDRLETIAISTLWKGLTGVSDDEGCEILVEEICRFIQQAASCTLKKIYLLDMDTQIVDKFCQAAGKHLRSLSTLPSNGSQKLYSQAVNSSGTTTRTGKSGSDRHGGVSSALTRTTACVQCELHDPSVKQRNCGHFVCGTCAIPALGCADCHRKKKALDAPAISRDERGKFAECPICLSPMRDPKTLRCSHTFCADCIDQSFKSGYKLCPICKAVCGKLIGNQPDGKMDVNETYVSCAGYESCGSYIIDYRFPGGVQKEGDPNPGKPYRGTNRRAYLPKNTEGKKILQLLDKAFKQRLIFTIGQSVTTGREDVVTWNDIHHKTSQNGEKFGYPDPTYLSRVREELKAKGITESSKEGTPV